MIAPAVADSTKWKLHPAVFYRQLGDAVIAYHTGLREVMELSLGADAILEQFRLPNTAGEAIRAIQSEYSHEDADDVEQGVLEFIQMALERGLIEGEFKQHERRTNLEREISRKATRDHELLSVTFELTYRCNERCRHCYVVQDRQPELSLVEIKGILDQLAAMSVCNVTFTGGEVFMRKDAFEILRHAYDRGFVVDVFTNGALLRAEDWIRLKTLWPRCVHFSVYSHIPEKHDSVTMVKGSWERTMASLRGCAAIGIPVNVKSSVLTETVDDIEGIVRLAESVGASIEMGRSIIPRRDGDLRGMLLKVRDRAAYDRSSAVIDGLLVASEDEDDASGTTDGRICAAGEHSLSISPSGEVFPCVTLPMRIGNVRERPMREIWESSTELQRWRRINLRDGRNGCTGCALSAQCIYCPGEALMRSGSPVARYEDACIATQFAMDRTRRGGEDRVEEVREASGDQARLVPNVSC